MSGPRLMRWDIINALLTKTKGRRFLEIGIQHGICGSHVRASHRTGVDPEHSPRAKRHYQSLHRVPSDDFFRDLARDARFDVILVDGLHHAEQVSRDVDNALRHLAPGGFIVMHDCNPQNELAQRVPRATGVWNGDCWKAMVRLRQRADVDAFTVDTDHGVGIVHRATNQAPLADVPADPDYQTLAADRVKLLGLVTVEDWHIRLANPRELGRVAVVSAIFGGRDNPLPAPVHDVDEHVLFTDGATAPGWRTVIMPTADEPRREARRIKTLAFDLVDADTIVWVDGRIRVSGVRLRPLLRSALAEVDIAGYPHPWRSCAYDEGEECAELALADRDKMAAQLATYEAAGLPRDGGLWNTMVLARRRTDAMVKLGRDWWAEIERHTLRDQVSLPFLLWRDGIEVGRLGPDVYRAGSSQHFIRGKHAS